MFAFPFQSPSKGKAEAGKIVVWHRLTRLGGLLMYGAPSRAAPFALFGRGRFPLLQCREPVRPQPADQGDVRLSAVPLDGDLLGAPDFDRDPSAYRRPPVSHDDQEIARVADIPDLCQKF